MEKKSIVFLAIIGVLVIVIIGLSWNLFSFYNTLENQKIARKFNYLESKQLIDFKLDSVGFQNSPAAMVFDKRIKILDSPEINVRIQNNLNMTKTFSIEFLPAESAEGVAEDIGEDRNLTLYDEIEIKYSLQSLELEPEKRDSTVVLFSPSVNEFSQSGHLKYIMNIYADGELYGSANVTVMLVRTEDMKDF